MEQHKQIFINNFWEKSKLALKEVNNKIFDKNLFKIYENAFANRMDSDYSYSTEYDIEEIKSNYEDAKYFINEIEKYLKQESIIK